MRAMSSSKTISRILFLLVLALIISVATITLDIISRPWLFGIIPPILLIAVANNDPCQTRTVARGTPRGPEPAA